MLLRRRRVVVCIAMIVVVGGGDPPSIPLLVVSSLHSSKSAVSVVSEGKYKLFAFGIGGRLEDLFPLQSGDLLEITTFQQPLKLNLSLQQIQIAIISHTYRLPYRSSAAIASGVSASCGESAIVFLSSTLVPALTSESLSLGDLAKGTSDANPLCFASSSTKNPTVSVPILDILPFVLLCPPAVPGITDPIGNDVGPSSNARSANEFDNPLTPPRTCFGGDHGEGRPDMKSDLAKGEVRWASLSRDLESADPGGLGRGPVGGGVLPGGGDWDFWVESRLVHFVAISLGSSSIHREVSLISDSILLSARSSGVGTCI